MTFFQVRLAASTLSLAFFGAMYLPGGGTTPWFSWAEPPASVISPKCEKLWIDDARNDPALECYLLTQKDRLCRADEKQHLIWFIGRYEAAKKNYDARLWGYLLGVQKGMTMPAGRAGSENEDTIVRYNRVSRDEALKLKADPAFVKAVKIRTLTDTQLTVMLHKLAVRGYIGRDDFGWRVPDWVSEAFTEEFKVVPGCKSPAA